MKARSRYLILSAAVLLILITLVQTLRFLLFKSASISSLDDRIDALSVIDTAPFKSHQETLSSLASYLEVSGDQDDDDKDEDDIDSKPETVWTHVPLSNLPNVAFANRRRARFATNCRLWNCFDFSRCSSNDRLRVHIYPPLSAAGNDISEPFRRILTAIQQSPYFEPDPDRACVFVPSIDLLDRDPLSVDFRSHVPRSFLRFEGRNHLLFNLYSGSWPSYDELDFAGFDPGHAMLVKASFGVRHFRPGFDISYPLYGRSHPFFEPPPMSDSADSGSSSSAVASGAVHNAIDSNAVAAWAAHKPYSNGGELRLLYQQNMSAATEQRHLLVFKGTRYVTGQGSDVRDALPLLHNGRDVHILTTCRKSRSPADQRCTVTSDDEQTYASTDYDHLMRNSTFCLIPRGRRLGSFRFLEALRSNCIPVLLSDEWLLPLHDVLDWQQAVLRPDQRTLLRLPDMLRSIGWLRVQRMRAAGSRLYHTYLSSVQQTVLSTLHLIEQRVYASLATRSFLWSGRLPLPSYLDADSAGETCERDLPAFRAKRAQDCVHLESNSASLQSKFTALVFVSQPLAPRLLIRLLRNLAKAHHLHQVSISQSVQSFVTSSTNRFLPLVH
jgi:glucuronyl/N-acetylglucosaminyl transferase EXT1